MARQLGAVGGEVDDAAPSAGAMAALGTDVEQAVTEVVGRWSGSLLRTARRHSLCDDDAQDAYQRTLELFLRNVEPLDRDRVHLWLHTVVFRRIG